MVGEVGPYESFRGCQFARDTAAGAYRVWQSSIDVSSLKREVSSRLCFASAFVVGTARVRISVRPRFSRHGSVSECRETGHRRRDVAKCLVARLPITVAAVVKEDRSLVRGIEREREREREIEEKERKLRSRCVRVRLTTNERRARWCSVGCVCVRESKSLSR